MVLPVYLPTEAVSLPVLDLALVDALKVQLFRVANPIIIVRLVLNDATDSVKMRSYFVMSYELISVTKRVIYIAGTVLACRPVVQLLQQSRTFLILHVRDHDLVVHEADTLFEVALYSLYTEVAAVTVVDPQLLDNVRQRIVFLLVASQNIPLEEVVPAMKDALGGSHEVITHHEGLLV